jgi:ribulose-phosphate 3-epimerase
MTINPGFGHQHFLASTLGKIRRVALMIEQANLDCELGVDGGIDETTAPIIVAAGANVLVAGTKAFGKHKGVADAMGVLLDADHRSSTLNSTHHNFLKQENLCN